MKKMLGVLFAAAMVCMFAVSANAACGDDGLVAYYPCNGNANDESGCGNNGTVVYGATPCEDRDGNPDSAYCFDGNDYIQVANSASLQSPTTGLTVAAWILINGWYNTWAAICAKSDDTIPRQYGFALKQNDGIVNVDVHGNVAQISTGVLFGLGQWYHAAYTWDSSEVRVYINGEFRVSKPLACSPQLDGDPLMIGVHTPGVSEPLNGKLDDIRIYDRALTAPEICELHHDPVPETGGNCSNGIDDDCDGSVDGVDSDCGGSCVGSVTAATLEASPVYSPSDLGSHFAYLLLPVGAFIGLMIWRRKRRCGL